MCKGRRVNAMQKAAGLSVGPSTDNRGLCNAEDSAPRAVAVGNKTQQPVEALEDLQAWGLKPPESTTVVVLGISRPVPPKMERFFKTQG